MSQKTQVLISIILGILGFYALMRASIKGNIYPAAQVGQVVVAGMSKGEAQETLSAKIAENVVTLEYNGYRWTVPNEVARYD